MVTRTSSLVASVISALGLLLGPVNLIYFGVFSGSKVATHRLTLERPLALQLSPKMNPIVFKAHATSDSKPRQRDNVYPTEYYYRATLTLDGEALWEQRFDVLRPRRVPNPVPMNMNIFSVDRAGTYMLTVRRDTHSFSPAGVVLHLHVSRNVVSPNLAVSTLGFFMVVVGVGWFLLTNFVRSAPGPEQDVEKPSTEAIPYGIASRCMPTGRDINTLLPIQVGPYSRNAVEEPVDADNPIYATYQRAGGGSVFVELGICADLIGARRALERGKVETDAESPSELQVFFQQGDVWCTKTVNDLGAFVAWTRGSYYFSAHAKGGEEELDEFMEPFPF